MQIGTRQVSIFSGNNTDSDTIVYMHTSLNDGEQLASELEDVNAVIVTIDGVDWNRELTPWPAKRAFKGGKDFAGGADLYLKELTETLIPMIEERIGLAPSSRFLAGYSLAGLFSIYAIYKTNIFNRIGSISGSLWYDGFLEFMETNHPLLIPERVYFSIGDREKINRNQRFSVVEERTIQTKQQLQRLGSDTLFELNPGNHFDEAILRMAKGLRWICD